MSGRALGLLVLLGCGSGVGKGPLPAPPSLVPDRTYRVLATAESDDQVALIEFRPCRAAGEPAGCGARVARTYEVGLWAAETEGPHGVVATPDGKTMYVSLAHGRPTGWLQKLDVETGRRLGEVELDMFPATVDIGPGGTLVYVINFNFEDPDMQPSSLSVVDGVTLLEVARPMTCRMPHGSRLNPQGTKHYSGCMMDDLLVEVDTRGLSVARLFNVAPGHEGGVAAVGAGHGGHSAHAVSNACSPTWAQPSADGARVFVACNRSADIVEVDVATWRMTRRWPTPPAPYNLAVTPDGRLLVVTQKGPGTTTIWRLPEVGGADAALLAEIPGTRAVASGVVVSPDSRYAFVTLEGVGGEPGTVDVIDLQMLAKVASVEMGKQAGGVWVLP